jgi:phosphoglycerate dehydrogenase-like enzyme
MSGPSAPKIALSPDSAPTWMSDAISDGGGLVTGLEEAEALIWGAPRDPEGLHAVLDLHPHLQWVQLPFAGIEKFVHLIDDTRMWTCGKGVYADPVAELALSLMLAGLRGLNSYIRRNSWSGPIGRNLQGARVTILGGGGITESLVSLLQPFDCHITVVRRRVTEMEGVDDVVATEQFMEALPGADAVVLALALTGETRGIIGRNEMEAMESHAWIVNVARGGHIVTDDLVWALREGVIGGAALDVTDPEPLPADHALWSLENCIITPHVGNTPDMAVPLLSDRIRLNVRRWADGDELMGPVHIDLGY